MTSRLFWTVVAAVGLACGAGCRSTIPGERLAGGDESISLFGPGRQRLDFGRLAAIPFPPATWNLPQDEAGGLEAALEVLARGRRIFLLGVGDGDVPSEHGRQQGLARALAVRRALAERGADPGMIMVTGMSAGEAEGLTGRGAAGPRVECAVVR